MGPLVNSKEKVSSQEETHSILNDYFGSVLTEETTNDKFSEVENIVDEDSRHMSSSLNITAEDTNQRINKLATIEAPGVDRNICTCPMNGEKS